MLYRDGNDVMHRSGVRVVAFRFVCCLREISYLLSYVKASGSFALNLDTKYKKKPGRHDDYVRPALIWDFT